jgi:hypothetical protein
MINLPQASRSIVSIDRPPKQSRQSPKAAGHIQTSISFLKGQSIGYTIWMLDTNARCKA